MRIPTQEEYFKKLRSDPTYISLLKKASLDERKKIINTVEYIAGSMLSALTAGFSSVGSDPESAKELIEAMKTGEGIIKESDGSPIIVNPAAEEKKE